jgi:hypothetical protein
MGASLVVSTLASPAAPRLGIFLGAEGVCTVSKRWMIIGLLAIGVSGITGGCTSGQLSPAAVAAVSPSPSRSAPAPTATPTASPTASPTATPMPTPSPTPTAKPTPVPWQVYKSKRFRYSIKYPPDWIVTPGSATRADLFDDFASKFVLVSRDTVSTWVDIEGTVDAEKAYMKSHYKTKLLSDKRVHVGSLSGRLLTFNGSDDGRKVYIQHLIIARGKVGYLLTMFSDRGSEKPDAKVFLRMYKSFASSS